MIITLGELGVPGSAFRSGGKTITGYRLRIFGTDTDVPIFDGCDPFATSCPGDLDGNGVINLIDLQIFIDWFLAGEAQADLDGDGDVDFNDLNLFRGIWIPGFCDRRDGFNGTDPFSGGSGGDGPSSRPI